MTLETEEVTAVLDGNKIVTVKMEIEPKSGKVINLWIDGEKRKVAEGDSQYILISSGGHQSVELHIYDR